MRTPSRDTVRALALETFSIVLAILLAVSVNNWRDARVHQEKTDQVLSGILGELTVNLAELEKTVPSQTGMMDTLRVLIPRTELGIVPLIASLGGVQGPELSMSAWDSAVAASLVESFDFDLLRLLSLIDAGMDRLEIFNQRVSQMLYAADAFDPAYTQPLGAALLALGQDGLNVERGMLVRTRRAIEMICTTLDGEHADCD